MSLAELRVTNGAQAGQRFALDSDAIIGRDESAAVVLDDTTGEISRRHARITLRGGNAVLEDLGSTNGTLLNDARVTGEQPLHSGDSIQIGATTLLFVMQSAPTGTGQLQTLSGPGAGTVAPLGNGDATIGRDPESTLQVLDPEVSRHHARITVRENVATIEDLDSKNGTYVNGERIMAPRRLALADRIQIGEATVELVSPIFEGTARRRVPPQISALRDVVVQSPKLLTQEGSRKWWTLAVVLVTQFMLLLDVTIVATALPTISADLDSSFSGLQWIVDGYVLTLAVFLLTAGSLADIFGRRRVLAIGLAVFVGASLLCSLATTTTLLGFARGLQGVGGALMFATGLALIVQEFPAKERAIAFGAQGAVSGIAVAVGPMLGGLLVENVSWQSVFYLNIPVGLAVLAVLLRKLANFPGRASAIDWGGLVTFSLAMFLAIFATIRGNADGWTSPEILGCFAGAVLLFAAFVVVELRTDHPMFDTKLFRNPTFVGASVSAFTNSFAVLALILYLTTWLQSVLGFSPVAAGLRTLVFTGALLLCAPAAGALSERISPRITLTLAGLLSAGGALLMLAVKADSEWTVIVPGLILSGASLGLIAPTLDHACTAVVHPWRAGMASGVNSTCREGGTAVGIAVLGSVLAHQVAVNVHERVAGTPFAAREESISAGISAGVTPQLIHGAPAPQRASLLELAQSSYAAGLRSALVVAAVVGGIGGLISLLIVRKRHLRVLDEEGVAVSVPPSAPAVPTGS